ncbi:ABC transporter substrate-binding protein [Paeniglutamicibacter kerguelensis]|uniref:NitT/TauT family transport system substrate-binding protein n=1 Tax=Paeniglutamicibacter kerguelensis TaxID=254788 RepID=A0ABS4XK01_9MICC|nr:MetQ/NlpA family ABC transporter substrate-binding protein [Paeniglutamicibacter kerguelensis]MBP2388014.1 NitT/TauT family transport system substrate-binding protein [Paeniglutamicibacter kerguelensis]
MLSSTPTRRALLGAGALALLLTATACAGTNAGAGAAEPGAATVKVGYFPLVHTATAVHASEAGVFSKNGINVELVQTQGGATAIPTLVSGNIDVTYTNYTSVLLAKHKGIPLTIISGNDVGVEDHGIFVKKDSGIESIADLKGKKFAVNNLQNIGTIAITSLLEEAGLQRGDVEIIEMPYPDMQAALDSGNTDAIWQVEPFQASAKTNGFTKIGNLFDGPVADMPVAGWITTEKFAKENPEAIKAFKASIGESAKELQDNRDELVKLVPTFTKVTAEVVKQIEMPKFTSDIDNDQLAKAAELMHKYGIIDKPLDVGTLLPNE